MNATRHTVQLPVNSTRSTRTPRRKRYKTNNVIGRGGMGEVVSVRDEQIGRNVAVKRMRERKPSLGAQERFLREAKIQARLDHPAIVPVHDLGYDTEGCPFFSMKQVTGTTLGKLLHSDRPPSRPRLLRAFVDVCLAIEFAHTRGVIHRDLKPDNIVVGEFGDCYVIDWGVAKTDGLHSDFIDVCEEERMTLVGTPGYMSPEQIRGERIGASTDVYALGCILYEILTGSRLHPPGDLGMQSALSWFDPRPSSRVGDVPPELDVACEHALGPEETRPSARELADQVQEYLDGDRDLLRRRALAFGHLERARAAFAELEFATGASIVEAPVRERAPTTRDTTRTQLRASIIREAGRALALDPTLTGAADLLARLMLEPPDRLPREVELELDRDGAATDRSQLRIGMAIMAFYFAFVPFLFRGGTSAYALGFSAILVANLGLMWRRARGGGDHWLHHPLAVAIRHAALIAILARAFSPLVLAPGIAAVTICSFMITPRFARPRAIAMLVIAMLAAILIPWFAELAGWVSPTVVFGDHSTTLQTGVSGGTASRAIGWTVVAIAMIGAATLISFVVLRTERESRRRVHLQAWHLRQLIDH